MEQRLAGPRAWSKTSRGPERGQGLAAVLPDLPIDLTRGEVGSIKQDLHFELCGPNRPN